MDEFLDFDFTNQVKKEKELFIPVVCVSATMQNKMNEVNHALSTTYAKMNELDKEHNIAKVYTSILSFSNSASWMPVTPQPLDNYNFMDLTYVHDGHRNFKEFYKELNDKLTEEQFLKDAKDYHPIILLITDGDPSDDYYGELKKLEDNEWFHQAIRIAVPIITNHRDEDDFLTSMQYEAVMDFTGNRKDRVFFVNDLSKLSEVLEIVTITSIKTDHDEEHLKLDQIYNLEDPFNNIRNMLLYHE